MAYDTFGKRSFSPRNIRRKVLVIYTKSDEIKRSLDELKSIVNTQECRYIIVPIEITGEIDMLDDKTIRKLITKKKTTYMKDFDTICIINDGQRAILERKKIKIYNNTQELMRWINK